MKTKLNKESKATIELMVKDGIITKEDAEFYFPELSENDDEKIRRVLLNDFKYCHSNFYCEGVNRDMIVDWLEKQGGHERVEKSEVYPSALNEAINLYYYSYGNGKGGFDNLSLSKFKDIVETFVNDYGEQKSVGWGEENERMIETIIGHLDRLKNYQTNTTNIDQCQDWLKSLKHQNTWKPSDEQLEELKYAIFYIDLYKNPSDSILWGLYEQLKKLREE